MKQLGVLIFVFQNLFSFASSSSGGGWAQSDDGLGELRAFEEGELPRLLEEVFLPGFETFFGITHPDIPLHETLESSSGLVRFVLAYHGLLSYLFYQSYNPAIIYSIREEGRRNESLHDFYYSQTRLKEASDLFLPYFFSAFRGESFEKNFVDPFLGKDLDPFSRRKEMLDKIAATFPVSYSLSMLNEKYEIPAWYEKRAKPADAFLEQQRRHFEFLKETKGVFTILVYCFRNTKLRLESELREGNFALPEDPKEALSAIAKHSWGHKDYEQNPYVEFLKNFLFQKLGIAEEEGEVEDEI